MIVFSLLCVSLLASRAASQYTSDITGIPDLRALLLDPRNSWSPGTEITFPDDGDVFTNATERWALYSPPTYNAAITPAGEEDVIRALNIMRENNIQFLATGGRHGYVTTFGALQNGVAIDLSNLNSVKVNKRQATLTIGGGVRTRDIIHPVSEAGLEMPLGGCSCPGLVGVTLAGGITNWVGTRGLLIDTLLSVRLVTANGRVVEASKKVNPDLFWAMRGAGTNFGIVLSATFQLFPPTNNDRITMIEGQYPPEKNITYYETLGRVAQNLDARLSINSIIGFDPASNGTVILFNVHFLGPEEEALELVAPLLDVGPTWMETHVVPWTSFHNTTLFGLDAQNCLGGAPRNPHGVLAKHVPVDTLVRSFERMDRLFKDFPNTHQTNAVFHSYGVDAFVAVPSDATAFPWRDAVHFVSVMSNYPLNDTVSRDASSQAAYEIRADIAENSGYDQLTSYMNFAHGDESVEQIFGPNLPRLISLKKKWDPENLFGYHYAIPTES
ncbi:hypothetical protein S7711_09426 [Stachybotrys chartarum IBT 7711]|uniref:FAD-binding PCMH-type domain-containing protein n=1 Tax=Stachybotrys chartarum (strain CBS 109288 / IBT 7711) TaxID=1280523 RepID=A0A084AL82_STACB|nr:hypothetical protein S7711_09426 [Stachybotrys chartarum IBT 7711]KFA54252.1 hypothetical protein S40293_07798 [Stachybotrys chartarum IBT 40293]KFA71124.1 hypothetical protein S40288_04531 [Stachybotrys chartarum IBT 40288]